MRTLPIFLISLAMSRYRRSNTEGGTFFFTVNSFRRWPLLTRPEVRQALPARICRVRTAHADRFSHRRIVVRNAHPTPLFELVSHVPLSTLERGTFFFTVNTFRRQPLLTRLDIREALRNGIEETRRDLPFEIVAWVLLPDHLHCIWQLPTGDARFGARWGRIKRYVSQACAGRIEAFPLANDSRMNRHESTLWQRRFWEHEIRDDNDLRRHVDYVHWNPVKHGYVSRVIDWPLSTFHRYVRDGVYPVDWGDATPIAADNMQFGE